ncbi:hypothetical protein [Streptomyces sp. NPDC059168]|uniref:hypothetical protein n=1 Tax=Streptomyces sp. NPDC059168 TaxID=3346753 RepID=UPI0036AF7F9C
MTIAEASLPSPRDTKPHLPLVRIALRQFWPLAVLFLLFAVGMAALLVHLHQDWDDAVALRNRIGSTDYHFALHAGGAHDVTTRLLDAGKRLALLPALYAALVAGLLTGREWDTRKIVFALGQSVTPVRWFVVRWTVLAALLAVPLAPVVALYRLNVTHAVDLDLLTYGIERHTAYSVVGPVTVAYVLLGVAAGALAGTVLRNFLAAAVAGPVLTWLLVAVLVRSRAALLLDFPAWPKVDDFHSGGVLGLQFYDVLPVDSFLVNSLGKGDYWPYQLAESALAVGVAVLLALAAFRVLRHRIATR